MQRVAVHCSELQCVAACFNVLQRVAVCCSVIQECYSLVYTYKKVSGFDFGLQRLHRCFTYYLYVNRVRDSRFSDFVRDCMKSVCGMIKLECGLQCLHFHELRWFGKSSWGSMCDFVSDCVWRVCDTSKFDYSLHCCIAYDFCVKNSSWQSMSEFVREWGRVCDTSEFDFSLQCLHCCFAYDFCVKTVRDRVCQSSWGSGGECVTHLGVMLASSASTIALPTASM